MVRADFTFHTILDRCISASVRDDKHLIDSEFFSWIVKLELHSEPDAAAFHRRLLSMLIDIQEEQIGTINYPSEMKQLTRSEFARIRDDVYTKPDRHFSIQRHSLRCDYRIACFGRIPAGVEHVELGGIPRSLLYRGGLKQAGAFMRCMISVKRPRPFYNIHLRHAIKPWTFLLVYNREAQKEVYSNVAKALQMNPPIRGLIATSWWYDPQLDSISPHLSFLREEMVSGGAFVFLYKKQIGHSLANSPLRKSLFERGDYHPCSYTVVWPRDRMIAWLARQSPTLRTA